MIAGQLTFHVTRPRTSATVPRCTVVNSTVNTKNMATPKISSGMTKDRGDQVSVDASVVTSEAPGLD
jgi:hypothetical protein